MKRMTSLFLILRFHARIIITMVIYSNSILSFLVALIVGTPFIQAYQPSNPFNDLPFHTTLIDETDMFGLFDHSMINNSSCREVWCESAPNPYNNYYDDLDVGYDGSRGFWLEPPPDDILYIPPPPMPSSLNAFFNSMENESIREFIIGDDPIEGIRCNFCKLFADPKVYQDDDGVLYGPVSSLPSSKDNETFVSLFYVLVFSLIFVILCIVCLLIKYKKIRIFSNHSCPVWSSPNHVMGHHHKSSSSTSTSPSDTCLSPVVNEKSPQSIIMDAPLASLGKKSTISTTGKYWKRIPNNVSGNILFMEDRRGLRSLGGSSTGISDHPYSDAASCTSSPVYAELDPAVAASCQTPPMIGPPIGTSFAPYAFANTYTEVPESMRHNTHTMSSNLGLSDSSTYDNAAYLSASSQPFLPGNGHYNSRSLRRLAAQRSAAINAAAANNQISTPLLSNQQYPPYHPHHHLQQQGINIFTNGRHFKKSRHQQPSTPLSVNYYKYGNTISSRPMNHYVSNETSMMTNETDLSLSQNDAGGGVLSNGAAGDITMFSSFLDSTSNGSGQRKSSASSSQYTEMPLISAQSIMAPTFGNGFRMTETCSNNDLNSAASSSTTSGGGVGSGAERNNGTMTNSSSAASSTSLKRPLPPVPNVRGAGVQL